MKKIVFAGIALAVAVPVLASCSTDANVASHNLSVAAEQFQIARRIVFFNGITDKYLLEIDGYCSVETSGSALAGSLEVTCKTSPTTFKKHYLGLSDNVSYFVEQIDDAGVSVDHYKVIFKPSVIVPDISVQ